MLTHVYKLLLKFFIRLHNYSYGRISLYAKKLNKNLHPKHEIMGYYQFFLENINEGSKILDIGCGIGYLTKILSQKAKNVVGIDIDKKNINLAKKYYNNDNILYIQGDLSEYKFNEKFDFVIMSNVLEHVKERKKILEKIKKITDIILIRVPLITRSWLPIYIKRLGLEYRLDYSHYIEYDINSFKNEIESTGLKLISYQINFGEIWAKITTF